MRPGIDVVEASIADLREALEVGAVTSVELVAAYLDRIAAYDRSGTRLNAVPVLNPEAFADARASDARRAAGGVLGPLDGIPYTAKDSYAARGLTVAAGSPAFRDLVAGEDAFAIARLRAAGAVLIGLTNMPPMANGGMQRGVYGRAESPYNAEFLTAAFGSGSSNGSGTATAASFAAFGLGEETWSSGRAPASNNGLVAYTPSRGVISVRGNWPLVPTMDVVVPHTRTVADLLELLDVIVADDTNTRGNFWRSQPWVPVPAASSVRPDSYPSLRDPSALRGRRIGIPRMYINGDDSAAERIETRRSIVDLWDAARADLEALGADVVEVDFPVVTNYERQNGAASMVDRGFVPAEFADRELWDLSVWGWDTFLRANGDPDIPELGTVDGALIFPHPTGALPDRYDEHNSRYDGPDVALADYVVRAKQGVPDLEDIPVIAEGIRGLEHTREVDLEQWMDGLGLDAVVFPAVADVGPADADVNPVSAALAWRNGTWVANGNLVPRHLGIPTVTVPMGVMADIGMPVGLTFAGRAYDDSALLRYAGAFEEVRPRRIAPPRTPALDLGFGGAPTDSAPGRGTADPSPAITVDARADQGDASALIAISGTVTAAEDAVITVHVAGVPVRVERTGSRFVAQLQLPAAELGVQHSEWRRPYGVLVVATVWDAGGAAGAFAAAGGIL
jgi:amidase